MPDRHGNTLSEGDPVIYHHDDETAVSGTVLREVSDGRYLIQLDPSGPVDAPRQARRDQLAALVAQHGASDLDSQEPFEVDGGVLEFFGECGDEDQDD